MNIQIRKFFMPLLTGPGCILDESCPPTTFPVTTATCICEQAVGGVNELYFIPCTSEMTEENITDTDWWTALVGDDELGRSGAGLGSIGKKSTRTDRTASCRAPQVTGITWALKFVIKCFDKTSAKSTCAKMKELITKFDKYLVMARMCEGSEEILPIGIFTTSDFDWVVPDNSDENQQAVLEISWNELGFPCSITVAGLQAIVPKLL